MAGLAYFEYRRHLFLAGLSPPEARLDRPLSQQYVIPAELPEPLLPPANRPPDISVERLEKLLLKPGAIESEKAWGAGIGGVYKSLIEGKKLARPLRLGLVIKVLRAGEGMPDDSGTNEAPDSPPFLPDIPTTVHIPPPKLIPPRATLPSVEEETLCT
ncbi:MAG: hypothetical protein TREMPRED_000457 [Tremellales sp. Tagirdzhanova-0007]|nr:MAG: hypothetical protein TREMPRED_000457 [Tremellales sp. Tagirdzhanova-0007]